MNAGTLGRFKPMKVFLTNRMKIKTEITSTVKIPLSTIHTLLRRMRRFRNDYTVTQIADYRGHDPGILFPSGNSPSWRFPRLLLLQRDKNSLTNSI